MLTWSARSIGLSRREVAVIRILLIALFDTASLFGLNACETGQNEYFKSFAQPGAKPSDFFACHGYGCKYTTRVSLGDAEWRSVRAILESPAPDAQAERRRAANAVARLEQLVGQRTGTYTHQRREGSWGDPTQLDCIDEAVNTWTYLTMIDRDGLLRFHAVGELAHGGTVMDFDVRNTATLVAKADGKPFAIDPTLVDEGEPPPVFPLSNWMATWPPEIPDADR
jgi:hypothetical protein